MIQAIQQAEHAIASLAQKLLYATRDMAAKDVAERCGVSVAVADAFLAGRFVKVTTLITMAKNFVDG